MIHVPPLTIAVVSSYVLAKRTLLSNSNPFPQLLVIHVCQLAVVSLLVLDLAEQSQLAVVVVAEPLLLHRVIPPAPVPHTPAPSHRLLPSNQHKSPVLLYPVQQTLTNTPSHRAFHLVATVLAPPTIQSPQRIHELFTMAQVGHLHQHAEAPRKQRPLQGTA